MLKTNLIRLTLILLTASGATVIRSQAIPTTPSVDTLSSSATAPALSGGNGTANQSACEDALATANARLLKILDAYDKAVALVAAKDNEIEARKRLDDLKNDLLAAKDQFIKDVMADNDFLRKDRAGKTKSRLRKFFERAEKILLIGAGVYLGGH